MYVIAVIPAEDDKDMSEELILGHIAPPHYKDYTASSVIWTTWYVQLAIFSHSMGWMCYAVEDKHLLEYQPQVSNPRFPADPIGRVH